MRSQKRAIRKQLAGPAEQIHAWFVVTQRWFFLCFIQRMFQPPLHEDPRTYQIIGAALEVHRVLGAGFLELFYKDALAIEFNSRRIPFRSEVPTGIEYKGQPLRGEYRMDFVCFEQVVLEVKARSNTGPADHAQVISYLASSKLRTGLLLNFGGAKLEYKRFIWTPMGIENP